MCLSAVLYTSSALLGPMYAREPTVMRRQMSAARHAATSPLLHFVTRTPTPTCSDGGGRAALAREQGPHAHLLTSPVFSYPSSGTRALAPCLEVRAFPPRVNTTRNGAKETWGGRGPGPRRQLRAGEERVRQARACRLAPRQRSMLVWRWSGVSSFFGSCVRGGGWAGRGAQGLADLLSRVGRPSQPRATRHAPRSGTSRQACASAPPAARVASTRRRPPCRLLPAGQEQQTHRMRCVCARSSAMTCVTTEASK